MDMAQVGQLVMFVVLVSIPLVTLDVAMRRSKQRGARRSRDRG